MSRWRPRPGIRVIALGLHWRAGRLLAAEVRDDAGRLKGVRPLGGGVEFGETWNEALAREFREELGLDVEIGDTPLVLENLYVHEGVPGHEIVFAVNVRFPEGAFADEERLTYEEDGGGTNVARWFDPDELDLVGGPCLFPAGLKPLLAGGGPAGPST